MGKPLKKTCENCEKEYWGQKEARFCSRKCYGIHVRIICKSGKEICKTKEEREEERIKKINKNFVNRLEKSPVNLSISQRLSSSHAYKIKEPAFMKRFNACRG